MRALQGVAIALVLGGCSSAPTRPTGTVAATPDTALGLHPGSVFEADAPPVFQDVATAPGESHGVARSWPGEPPVIPHSVDGFVPITAASNSCLDCHASGGDDAPQLPASHRADLRRSPSQVAETAVGSRAVCLSCHLAQTDAAPLVGNSADPPAAAGR